MSGTRRRAGFTLVELVVALAILSLSAALASVAFRALLLESGGAGASRRAILQAARRDAVVTGRPVVVRPDSVGEASPVLFLPDGRSVGGGVDPLTGRLSMER